MRDVRLHLQVCEDACICKFAKRIGIVYRVGLFVVAVW
jgi:hypothetical protein